MINLPIQKILECPFCKSKNISEVDRFSVINASAMFQKEDRGDKQLFFRPVNAGTEQEFICNDCKSHFKMRNYNSDIEVINQDAEQ